MFPHFAEEYCQKITWIKEYIKYLLFMSKYCPKVVSIAPGQDYGLYIIWPGFINPEMKVNKKVLPFLHLVRA